MGIILGFSLFIGVFVGVIMSIFFSSSAVIFTKKAAKKRRYVWRTFILTVLILLPVLIFLVSMYPFDTGKPGSNYGILFKYYFIFGLIYSATPGVVAALGYIATLFCKKRALSEHEMKDKEKQIKTSSPGLSHVFLPISCVILGFLIGLMFFVFADLVPSKTAKKTKENQMISFAAKLYQQGKYQDCILQYTKAIESGKLEKGQLSNIYARRGWAYSRLENNGAASADFAHSLQLNPKSPEALNGLGWTKAKNYEYDAAIKDYDKVLKSFPSYAMVYNNRGVACKISGKRELAKNSFHKAIELDNDTEAKAYALFNLAWMDYQDGKFESAFSTCDKGVKIMPDYALGYNDRGAIREDLGQKKEAIADFSKAIELDNDPEATSYARLNRGISSFIDREYVTAENDFTQVIKDRLPMKEYAAVWLFICLKNKGMDIQQINLEIAKLIPEKNNKWPSMALDLFNGQISTEEFSAAYWHRNPEERRCRQAEMLFFTGQYWLFSGEKEKADKCFKKCIQLKVHDSNATRMAKSILDGQPN
jgi:lipoprotein NlpI